MAVKVLIPSQQSFDSVFNQSTLPAFDSAILNFLQDLSANLLRGEKSKQSSDCVALGFWLRKANINRIQQQRAERRDTALGVVFHYAPKNVDTMFVYSWVCSALMGNINVVRLPSALSPMMQMLVATLNALFAMPEHESMASRNRFIQFDYDDQHNNNLSLHADARVIWGGDESVTKIRSQPCKPRCRDIAFSDRYSASLIAADSNTDLTVLAERLWKDTEPFSQQACSSPKLIFWLGDKKLLQSFCEQLNHLAGNSEQGQGDANERLLAQQMICMSLPASERLIRDRVCVTKVKELHQQHIDWLPGAGSYLLIELESAEQVKHYLNGKIQTLSHAGIEQSSLENLLGQSQALGVDRLVPLGTALEFEAEWDGYDLLTELSRRQVYRFK